MSYYQKRFVRKKKEDNPENKKVRNAKKQEYDGIKFDSSLELYCYKLLKAYNVDFEIKKKYVLQPGFFWGLQKIQPITLTVDFYLPKHNALIDPKGFFTDDATLKFKMLKYYFVQQDLQPDLYFPKNQKEVLACVERILKIQKLL